MRVNDAGRMIRQTWNDMPGRYPGIETDEFVVMPNHFHGIIFIVGAPLVGAHFSGTPVANAKTRVAAPPEIRAGTRPAPTLGNIIGEFKSITTHQYVDGIKQENWPPFNSKLWQRNYYEHIIRSEEELHRIRQYIIGNPVKWDEDEDNPENIIRRGEVSSPSSVAIIPANTIWTMNP